MAHLTGIAARSCFGSMCCRCVGNDMQLFAVTSCSAEAHTLHQLGRCDCSCLRAERTSSHGHEHERTCSG